MAYKVKLTPAALASLREIYRWSKSQWSKDQANHYVRGLRRLIKGIADHPQLYPITMEKQGFEGEVHYLFYPLGRSRHRILYTIEPDLIIVLSIRHTAQASES